MLFTKRSDYAVRICRALKDGSIHNVTDICKHEEIPKAFAYKIIREMEQHNIVSSVRGNHGGYQLIKGLDEMTLYDIVSFTEEDIAIVHCMKEGCERNTAELPCKVHCEMERIQQLLEEELKKKTLDEIINS